MKVNEPKEHIESPRSMKFTMKVNLEHPVTVYSLVLGGWLPLAFSSARVHAIDRNILIWLRNAASEGARQRSDYEANRWWLDFLNRPGLAINPLFCAMEGAQVRVPTLDEFRMEYERACDDLSRYFPNSNVLRHESENFEPLYEIVANVSERNDAEIEFLCRIAPVVRERKSGGALRQAHDFVVAQAQDLGFKLSFTLVAALSCLYEGSTQDTQVAAKRVIKPTASYSKTCAHNALSDIRALEILAAGSALNGPTLGLCTRDRALSALWCHLGIERAVLRNGLFTVMYGLTPQMFPTLSGEERADLLQGLNERGLV